MTARPPLPLMPVAHWLLAARSTRATDKPFYRIRAHKHRIGLQVRDDGGGTHQACLIAIVVGHGPTPARCPAARRRAPVWRWRSAVVLTGEPTGELDSATEEDVLELLVTTTNRRWRSLRPATARPWRPSPTGSCTFATGRCCGDAGAAPCPRRHPGRSGSGHRPGAVRRRRPHLPPRRG